ncbi:MBL fold metallo-hydrolase [Phaeacidiphilus oryzae]|uniref:MBL fold metallo-hydrolase n=1 Tax=Phaeacidiphilus oryzae TaxID=348818 RepID=UPI00056275BF|nr:MBL fold metallo-hydrolase [Phaeacidiphilus oryzae]
MRAIKYGHACVRLEKDGQVLVLDPGAFSEPEALDGADAVLITHEHFDHWEPERLKKALDGRPGLRVWTNDGTADQLEQAGIPGSRISVVGHGDAFTAAGFEVEAHGEWHAVIHQDVPLVKNTGFLIDGQVFHPGDALTVPEHPVDTLLLPAHAPWSKLGELVDYMREVGAKRAYGIHDALLSELGQGVNVNFLGQLVKDTPYTATKPGDELSLA